MAWAPRGPERLIGRRAGGDRREILLGELAERRQQEVRWHGALMLPRLELSAHERERAEGILTGHLADRSRIVQVNARQGLAELAASDGGCMTGCASSPLNPRETGAPSVVARARRLLADLGSARY